MWFRWFVLLRLPISVVCLLGYAMALKAWNKLGMEGLGYLLIVFAYTSTRPVARIVALRVRNCRAEKTVLNLGRFAGSGVWHVQKRPASFYGRGGPKRPIFARISLTSSERGGRMPTYLCKKNPPMPLRSEQRVWRTPKEKKSASFWSKTRKTLGNL